MPQDPKINGRPLQWRDLSGSGRKIVSDNIRETGENLPKIAQETAVRMQATHERTGNPKAKVQATSAAAVAPHLKSKPVTLQTAANSRQRLYNRGIEDRAAANPEDQHQVIPTGAGWYFEHHRDIASAADKHGFPHDWAIAASGVMSPQNSPENEKVAVSSIMDALSNRKVKITPEVHEHLAKQGIDVTKHLGKTVNYDALPPGTIAHLSSGSIRDRVETDANLHQVARGGTKQNITRAEHVLAGDVHPDDAVDPHSAPKVWSYVHNTRKAVPDTPTHVEFMGRVHKDALVRRGQVEPEQGTFDLYGHQDSPLPDDHLLSPKSHTVEDTWQNAATFDQPKTMAQGRTSVFKAAGSLPETYPVARVKTRVNEATGKKETAHPDARLGNAAITHAFNNRATQKAAEQQGVPPVAMQEVGWVQMRKDAGKDPEFNQRKAEKADPLAGHVRGQMALFGPDLPPDRGSASRATPHPTTGDGEEVANPEADMRKWAAIGNNTRRSRFRRQTSDGIRDLTR